MDWRPEQSRAVLVEAGRTVGQERRSSIGSELRALVTLAHALNWLSSGADPMKEVAYTRRAKVQGETASYVPMKFRPTSEQVKALMEAMAERCRLQRDASHSFGSPPQAGGRRPRLGRAHLRGGRVLGGARRGALGMHVRERPPRPWTGQLHLVHTLEQVGRERRLKVLKGKLERYTLVPEDVWPDLAARAEALVERFGEERGRYALLFLATDHDLRLVELDPQEAERRGQRVGTKGWVDLDTWDRSEFRRSLLPPSAKSAGWPTVLDFSHLRHHFPGYIRAGRRRAASTGSVVGDRRFPSSAPLLGWKNHDAP